MLFNLKMILNFLFAFFLVLNHHEGYSYGLPGSNRFDASSSSQIQESSQNTVATAVNSTSQDQIDSAKVTAKEMVSIELEKELSDAVNQEKPITNPVDADKDAAFKYSNCMKRIAEIVDKVLNDVIDSTMQENFIKKYCASEKDS